MMKPKVQPLEVHNALQSLGLDENILTTAILQGEYARNSCTKNDPRCVPGVFAWAKCSRSLRDQLIPKGWERNDDQNRATIISPDRKTAISVEIGDDATGNPDLLPNTKYQKGDATVRAVNANQPALFDMYLTEDEIFLGDEMRTWLLLRRPTDSAIYAELSLPAPMIDGRIEQWLNRIILSPIPFDYDFSFNEDSTDEPIEINISRRQQ
jgi:hypothetical protein